MSRRRPVAFCLMDVGFLSDAKFRKLVRRLPDPDDLNSAVGAYFIALAASRRNGSHEIDARAETDSRFIDDLKAVGLLDDDGFPPKAWNAWDAMSPQRVAGQARAESAVRNDAGRFTSASSALDIAGSAGEAGPAFPSPPIPSIPLQESEGVQGEDVWATYCGLTGSVRPSPNVVEWLTRLEDRYGCAPLSEAMRVEWAANSERRTLLGRVERRLEKAARQAESKAETAKLSDARQSKVDARRLESFRWTGRWDPDLGPEPEWRPEWGVRPAA